MSSKTLNMLHSLKPFLCPNCNFSYSTKDVARFHSGTRFPRILPCSHSVCENCLQAAEKKNSNGFSCPVCKVTVKFDTDDPFAKLAPDIHALGIISVNMKNALPSLKVKMIPSTAKRSQSIEFPKNLESSIICGHCHQNQALWQCDDCQLNFCSICFKEVHNEKGKKRHEGKRIFAELYNSMVQEGCSEHENKTVEFYCEVDNQLTCSYCMLMGSHVGHEVKTLVDKNKSCADDIKNVLEDISNMQKRLKYTDHLLCEVIPKEKVDISETIKNVHDYFHQLHATLQMREAEVIAELTEVSQHNVKPLEKMRLEVTGYERDLASLKKDAESVIENPCLAVSAPAILRKLEESKNLPCFLVPLPNGSGTCLDINLNLDSDLEKKLKELGQIHFNGRPRFALLPSNDLPEKYCTQIPESFSFKSQVSLESESCSNSVDTFSEDSLSVTSNKISSHSSMQASLKYRDFTRMQPEKVIVSHIKNPSSFYVQSFSEMRRLKPMSDSIDKWCKSHESRNSKVVVVETGDLYLVKYSVDNRWYRARVKGVKQDEFEKVVIGKKSPLKLENGSIVIRDKEPKYEVFYIDYGNTEVTTLSNMKNIHSRFLHLPGVAKHCCLADIEPANKTQWCSDSVSAFAKFVSNKPVIMQIFEERNNIFRVDLCQIADNDISSDVPVSVRDALIFLELAVFPSGIHKKAKRGKAERNYMPPEPLRVNSNICAIVSHVDDPDHLYVQQMSTASYLSNLIYEMNETYNKEGNSLLHGIYAPQVGMVCAAQFSIDKQWYRAKILGLPGGAQVKVQYVDFGNTEVIHHKHLRKLFDKFFKLNIQAIPCKLAQVTYNQAKSWSKNAKEWLTKQVSRKQLTLKSLGMIPGENKAEVVIFYNEDNCEVCINALLVEEGFAESTGDFSATVRQQKKAVVEAKKSSFETKKQQPSLLQVSSLHDLACAAVPTIEPPHDPLLEDIPPPSDEIPLLSNEVLSPVLLSPPHAPESSGILEKEKSPLPKNSPKKKYPSLAPPSDGADHIEVHVSHIENPGTFYIRLAGDNEKKLNLLMNELQKVYENLQGEIVECSVGKAYAVYSPKQKKWLRGTVLSKIDEENIEIHYVDYGNTEGVKKIYLRKLIEKFSVDESFSISCHLAGIIPAGGSSQWSHSASDIFRALVASHEILLLSSKGEFVKETKSLPADLLIEQLKRGGALEPTTIEYISITAEIIKHGYALPVRRKAATPPASKVSETLNQVPSETSIKCDLPLYPKNVACETAPKCISSDLVDSTVLTSEEDLPPEKPNFQWLPAIPPLETVFQGFVTNIGDDGSIHLYLLKKDTSQVDTIKKSLQYKYNKLDYEPLTKLPAIGEACVAKFSVDNEWYRAEVLSVYPGKVKVNFVDYGNNEIVPLSYVRTDLCMKTIHRQCLECSLFGIPSVTNGKWDNDLLTFLHNQLVESEVTVEIQASSDNKGRLQTRISTISGIDVGELLVSMGFGDEDENAKVVAKKPARTSTANETFARAQDLREGDVFPVCITQIPSENIVYLQILKIPEPKDIYEMRHNDTYDAFLQLIGDLRENADSFPLLEKPLPGMSCCAKYSYDDSWYRCEVTDLTEDGVVVLYVDYGNSEVISADNLRELPSQFIHFPVQIHFCELHGIKPAGSEWDPRVRDILVKNLLTNTELYAKVMLPGNITQVQLLIKTEGGFKLAYEELLEKKLAVLKESSED